jgi:putative spermidine/putrescine transport system ATP-binding protein
MSAGLEIRSVSKGLGATQAVRDVSLTVNHGEFFTLLGSSGSGKSTTLNLVAGFLTPDSGHILIDGKTIDTVPVEQRGIGFVFQSYALFPHMTVRENLAFPLRRRGVKGSELKSRVNESLELVQLQDRGESKPSDLSGGQQQRVALARALIFEPTLVLLDEPLGALDRRLRLHLQEQLRALHDALGFTAIYVTHDQEEALALSDRVGVMSEGRLLQVASTSDIYRHPSSAFVARFLGDANLVKASVVDVSAGRCRAKVDGGHLVEATVPAEMRPKQTDDVMLIARPEALVAQPAGADNLLAGPLLDGRLLTKRFLGQDLLATVRCVTGDVVHVRERPGGALESIGAGDEVTVCWRTPGQAGIVPMEESTPAVTSAEGEILEEWAPALKLTS